MYQGLLPMQGPLCSVHCHGEPAVYPCLLDGRPPYRPCPEPSVSDGGRAPQVTPFPRRRPIRCIRSLRRPPAHRAGWTSIR